MEGHGGECNDRPVAVHRRARRGAAVRAPRSPADRRRRATLDGSARLVARTETVTVVFTDLVGSTELASRLGHDAYEALRHQHFAALRSAVAKHGGVEVKTTGDGLMLRFDSAAAAVA